MSSRATRKSVPEPLSSFERRWHVLHTCRTQLCVPLDYRTIVGGYSFVFRSVIVFLAFSDFSVVLLSAIITRSVGGEEDAGAKLLRVYSLSGEKKIQFNTFHTSLLGLLVSLFSFFFFFDLENGAIQDSFTRVHCDAVEIFCEPRGSNNISPD